MVFKKLRKFIFRHKITTGLVSLLLAYKVYTHVDYNYISPDEQKQMQVIFNDYELEVKEGIKEIENLNFKDGYFRIKKAMFNLEKAKKIGPIDKAFLVRIKKISDDLSRMSLWVNIHDTNQRGVPWRVLSDIRDSFEKDELDNRPSAKTEGLLSDFIGIMEKTKTEIDPTLHEAYKKVIEQKILMTLESKDNPEFKSWILERTGKLYK